MIEVCKPICIMDTDSLLFSFKLECPPVRAIDRISRHFDLYFPYKVLEESKNNIKGQNGRIYDDIKFDIDLFFKQKMKEGRVYTEDAYSSCLKHVHRWFNLIGEQEKYHILGDGEKHCVALGLYLSRVKKENLIVMTDDFRAINAGFDIFVAGQRIGLISPLIGTMLFIYFINKDISEVRIRGIVNDYFKMNHPKHFDFKQYRMEILKDIKLSCRVQSFDDCKIHCLT